MQIFRSVLVAVDGSRASNAAIAAASTLARDFHASIRGCHVLQTVAPLQGRYARWLPQVEADKRREALEIAREAETLAEDFGTRMKVTVAEGDPIDELLRFADAMGADSIVVGNRGQNAFSTLLIGSVAQGVIERSTAPVIVVRAALLDGKERSDASETARRG